MSNETASFAARLVLAAAALLCPALARAAETTAAAMIAESGVRGGLAVVVNGGDGRLAAGLGSNASFLVHDLENDQAAVAKARAAIKAAGLHGRRVSVDLLAGSRLPYVDNAVKLLILAADGTCPMDEVMRVLAPGGVAMTRDSGRWQKTVKPWPKTIDQWTHHMHAPDGNTVAEDTVVAPPNHVQWVASPDWSREHRYVMHSALVSANGRNLYVANEVPVETLDGVPDRMVLVARDAFSGVLLWKRPLEDISKVHRPEQPGQEPLLYNPDYPLPLKMAAVGDTLYAAFGHGGTIVALDAASGTVLRKYAHTENTEELICHDDRLLVVIADSDAAGANADPGGENKSSKKSGKWVLNLDFSQVNNNTSVKKYRGTALRAIDATSGAVAWEYHAAPPSRLVLSPVIRDNRVFFACGTTLLCLDFVTGKPLWERPLPTENLSSVQFNKGPTVWDRLIACPDVLLLTCATSRTEIRAFSAADGKPLWTAKSKSPERSGTAAYVIGDTVWCGMNPLLGLDLHTGKQKTSVDTTKVYDVGHHHRCYGNRATTNFLLTGRRGVEFTGFDGGDIHLYHWLRGECRFGVLPCNGLLYTTPHGCSCYYSVAFVGYGAFAGKWADEGSAGLEHELRASGPQRLTKGPAYAAPPSSGEAGASPGDWATFRANQQRGNYAPGDLRGDRLKPAWRAAVGARPTALTVSAGRLFVADQDGYEVRALDADSGRRLWSFPTGAAVDSPPTIYNHLVLFGCSDGYAYCLREADGAVVWRFQAAPADKRLIAHDCLESVWPVHGAVLVHRGVAYFTAGRSSLLDGGIAVYAVQPQTGEVLKQNVIYTPYPEVEKKLINNTGQSYGHNVDLGVLQDILLADNDRVFIQYCELDEELRWRPTRQQHIVAMTGLLKPAWFSRMGWFLQTDTEFRETRTTGEKRDERKTITSVLQGQYLAMDHATVYCLRLHPTIGKFSTNITPGQHKYTIFADDIAGGRNRWVGAVPMHVTALALNDDVLFAAGSPDILDPGDPWGAIEGRKGGRLVALSKTDGKVLASYDLPSPAVPDGVALRDKAIFVSMSNGEVLRLSE